MRTFARFCFVVSLLTASWTGIAAQAATQTISLNATSDADGRYYEYYSDGFLQVGIKEVDGRNRFQSPIASPTIAFGGPTFDGFPHDESFHFGSLQYDDAGLIGGSGTVPITGANISFYSDPVDSTYVNINRFPFTTTLTSPTGTATFSGGTLTSIDFMAGVNINFPTYLGNANVGPYPGTFSVSGSRFDLLIDGTQTITAFSNPPLPSRVVLDFNGTIAAVPEPATVMLAAFGASALCLLKLRRKT